MITDNTREDYYQTIEVMADEIERRYDDVDNFELHEEVFEEVDATSWVIYTNKALAALQYSEEGPAEWQQFVGEDDSWQEVIMSMAFSAIRQDLYSELRRREIA